MLTVRSSTCLTATRPSTARGRELTPPTTSASDAIESGVMPKPPPPPNIPTEVTPTVAPDLSHEDGAVGEREEQPRQPGHASTDTGEPHPTSGRAPARMLLDAEQLR